ncbi:hypothetical protein ANCCAN_29391 [Ancylostoma caninum]|uniref:Uncharacterized protein n=1 Tax=Ancylostoma caninum TaxID=29170 RepID=A0A368EYS7_ANCCA|nr:hypothetical protein ANCCAN_29391 [Ancylostoma caninum]
MARPPTLSGSEQPEKDAPVDQSTITLSRKIPDSVRRRIPRSLQRDEQLPTLNSFHDTGYFSQYHLDDRVYSASFLLKTLKTLDVQERNARMMYYTTPLFNRLFRSHEQATFSELANEALQRTTNTTFEDLTKFKVAHLINNHLVYYLEAKRLLENTVGNPGK